MIEAGILLVFAALIAGASMGFMHWQSNRIPTAAWERKREARLQRGTR